jgi:hypothetical protein
MDAGASNLAVITHSVPILRNGKPIGVVGVDLSSAYFRVIRQWLDELNLGAPTASSWATTTNSSPIPTPATSIPGPCRTCPGWRD